jgi:hypothetical protein
MFIVSYFAYIFFLNKKLWSRFEKNEIEIHYQFLQTKFLATRHKQHFEFQYEFQALGWSPNGKYKIFILYIDLNLHYNI